MTFQDMMMQLEQHGVANDLNQPDKSRKYLNITRDTGEFLAILVKATGASQVLEIGTSNGYSTLWLASALPEHGKVYTIESNPQKAAEAALNFTTVNLTDKIVQVAGDVTEVLPAIPGNVDFIFLDADRKQYTFLAESLFGLLKEGGLLVCDNAISHSDELQPFTDWVNGQPHLSCSLVPVGKGELLVFKGGR
ncbi:O-methyltransferase [Oceanimonas baumannii]|uniref:O-methyltransferase n=1 Tax=Oceanimonas baumannii TaxID=129578 RepID=UPI001D18DCC9|nr:O-methyltransferase [Oceanimonas baumannii]MCC4263062.1 O-methyltransferase [Oceanimonas baumannii]